jgi:nucleoside-diphosphate-sugar epimerase
MVGPGLRKNPVFDILNRQPLRIHPDSRYQFMHTGDVARILWDLARSKLRKEIFNLCGDGLISPREIAAFAGKSLDLTLLPAESAPRIVDVNIGKISKIVRIPHTTETVAKFAREYRPTAS